MSAGGGELIRALLKQDWPTWDQLTVDLDSAGSTAAKVIGAAFFLAVDRRWTPETDVREIAQWVMETREYFAKGDELIPVREAEALVRAALGEDHLAIGIDSETTVSVEMQLLTKLVADLGLDHDQIDGLVSEAESMISGAPS